MAEVVGLVASVLTLGKLAYKTCHGIRSLHELLGELPDRLALLSNEVDDAKVVLYGLHGVLRQREEMGSEADDDDHFGDELRDDVALHVTKLRGHLEDLQEIVAKIHTTSLESPMGNARRAIAWKRYHGRLNDIQDRIVAAKSVLRTSMDSASFYTLSRIDVRLGEQSDADADRHDKLSTLVVNQNESLKAYITQQLAITAASMTGDMAPRLPKLHPNVKKARARRAAAAAAASAKYQALEPAAKKELDTVLVSVQSRRRFCPRACPCACHDTRRSNTPDVLGRVLGQLFVGYSGIPFVTPKCDHKSCSQNTAPKVQAEYWFPAHVFWSKIFRVEATYHAATGPSLQIRSFRHVPDSSPAVNYTINGNIDGLKTLFSQGMASPNDVSNTRGYSLLRWAVYAQQWETVGFLFDQGADADYRPKAASDNSPRNKASDLIMQGGLKADAENALIRLSRRQDWLDDQNLPLLHRIVLGLSGKSLERELLEHPESIDRQDAMGRTALLWAAARGDNDKVTTLLRHKADPNIMDCQHAGPVSYAADRNHTLCTRTLLAAGADPDPEIPGGYKIGSPLNCAARNATDPLLIKTLLEYGANVDACGVDGRTSLIHAARTDNIEFAYLLLQFNANINAVSTAGHTPLTTAIVNNSCGVLSLLLEKWDNYSTCPRLQGPHLLRIAAQYADLDTLTILLETDHFKLMHDEVYSTGDFETLLSQRPDTTEEMMNVFVQLMAMVRFQVAMETENKEKMAEMGYSSSSDAACPFDHGEDDVSESFEAAPPYEEEKIKA